MVPRALTIADLRQRRRGRHPGRPQGVRGGRRPRHVGARRAHRAEHDGVTAIHELPPEFVVAQLDAVFSDLGVDAAKTGMLFSRRADRDGRRLPRGAPRAARRRPGDGRELRARRCSSRTPSTRSSARLFPLATVVTPNLLEARALAGGDGIAARARRAAARARRAGRDRHGRARRPAVDHLFDGARHVEIPVERHAVAPPTAPAAPTRPRSRRCSRAASRSRRRRAVRRAPPPRRSATASKSSAQATGRSTSST